MSDEANATYRTAVTDTMNNHVTVRFFTNEPIPDEMLQAILDAARRAPTSNNMQTYSIVVVRNQETKKQLAVLAHNQKHIETAQVFLAFCADIKRLEAVGEMHGQPLVKTLETTLTATVDAAIVGMSVQTAAESFGLGAVMIGAMRNHPDKAAALLGLPTGVYVVFGMCLGWPDWDKVPAQKPRLPKSLVVHEEQYSREVPVAVLRQYDRELAAYYGRQDRNLDDAAWTGVIAERQSKPSRPHLRGVLEKMGFRFD